MNNDDYVEPCRPFSNPSKRRLLRLDTHTVKQPDQWHEYLKSGERIAGHMKRGSEIYIWIDKV